MTKCTDDYSDAAGLGSLCNQNSTVTCRSCLHQFRSSTRPATSASSWTVTWPWLITSHRRMPCRLLPSATTTPDHVDAAMTLVQSFISSHLDYCNSLFSGIIVCLGASSRCRTRQHDSSPAPIDVTILLQCWGNSTGFRSDNASTSSWFSWFTRRFMIRLQRISSMTASSSFTLAVAGYDRPTSTHVVSHGPTHGSRPELCR